MPRRVDVAVLGSGFGGSLLAILLDRLGLDCLVVERRAHPRFAVGESSTPIADLVLRDLAARYDLPWLEPLTRYGPWCRTYPEVRRGLKRGFSYFPHRPGEPFRPYPDHRTELLVAANRDDEHADTQWMRADVDAFLVARVREQGIEVRERTAAALEPREAGWRVTLSHDGEVEEMQARFVVDATGEGGAVAEVLELPLDASRLRTRSRAIFGHFEGVTPWHDVLRDLGAATADHPFRCDDAAQHHLLEEGWMWQLRFDHGVTSLGLVLDATDESLDPSAPVRAEWDAVIRRYPSLAAQLAGARLVAPEGGLVRTGRLQRRVPAVVGPGWALLPNAAGFVDPLHSTGIAQTLCGVERLAGLLGEHGMGTAALPALRAYGATVLEELDLIDAIVAAGYRSRASFRLFAASSMLYFAAATTYEHRRLDGELRPGAAFLCADDAALRAAVSTVEVALARALEGKATDAAVDRFEAEVARRIEPFNRVGLCDPAARNLYRYTAVP
jgi:FADH2 O2-dependent halogenase